MNFLYSSEDDHLKIDINDLPEPIIRTMGGIKDKIMSLFKITKNKEYSKPTRLNNAYESGKKPI